MLTLNQWRSVCEGEIGKPYIWGGSGPDVYDCSGFAQWALARINLDPPGDQTASGLYKFFRGVRSTPVNSQESRPGDLVFFGNEEAITHIGLAWGNGNMLEAGGGGRNTTSVAIARAQKAEVRIRPIARRSDLIEILRPHALPWSDAAPSAGLETGALEAAESWGHYEGLPALTEWLSDGRSMQLKRALEYVQEGGSNWPVPSETVVNGASIPRVFWTLIGGPLEGLYRDASIVHDHYCDIRTRSWQDTHRMFYEAMRCSGVGAPKAGVMYYAVYRFGPRWAYGPEAASSVFEASAEPQMIPIDIQVEPFEGGSFEADAKLIFEEELSLSAIEALADARCDATAQSAEIATLESTLAFETLAPGYRELYASCRVRPERKNEVSWYVNRLVQYRRQYEAVAARTGTPWWFIGVVHALEASFNFKAHLHNGDPLETRTVQVPKGRPAVWNPPNDWESSAIDAIVYKGLANLPDWDIAHVLYRWESFNGFGYYPRGINSPYLWSFSNHYTQGKFVKDHVYDPNAVSKQCGAAVLLRALQDAGLVDQPPS